MIVCCACDFTTWIVKSGDAGLPQINVSHIVDIRGCMNHLHVYNNGELL